MPPEPLRLQSSRSRDEKEHVIAWGRVVGVGRSLNLELDGSVEIEVQGHITLVLIKPMRCPSQPHQGDLAGRRWGGGRGRPLILSGFPLPGWWVRETMR